MINIALSGALGKMGRVIAELVSARSDCRTVAGADVQIATNVGQSATFPVYKKVFDIKENIDVIIDFSHSSALPDLLTYCKMKEIPLVAATTGYSEGEISEIKKAAAQIPIFFTGNMSLGINLLQDLSRRAARVLGEQFDIEIIERHHNLKKDAPSGTAYMLFDSINDEFGNKKYPVHNRNGDLKARKSNEIGMHAIRGGTIVGEHEIAFAGHDEVITLTHSALSKEVFAVGAINAAVFLKSQPKGLYDMSNLLSSI
ncbi:MAG: 4-hydroxy-tetrahydrodipicolinate reductase [Oscillospiraceae bacterium]|nr:4-hydroxy-tetrahydrodipicolinate reductase [Oscillospiraceae bacterium]